MWTTLTTLYNQKTSSVVKTIDAYLLCTMAIGLTMMFYCFVFSPLPYNSFLASFLNSVGSFVLAAHVRQQICQRDEKGQKLSNRHFYEVVIAHLLLNILVAHYI